jgi:hypothetical protein
MSEYRDELRQQLEAEQNFFNDSKAEELAFWQQKLAAVEGGGKKDLALRREINSEIFKLEKALAKEAERDAIEEQSYKQKVNDEDLSAQKKHLEALLSIGKITAEQEIKREQELVDKKLDADEKYYDAKMKAAEKDKAEMTKLEREEYLDHQKLVNERAALDDKRAEEEHKQAKEFVGIFTGGLGGALQGVITGRQTPGQAGMQYGEQILNKMITKVTDKLDEVISNAIEGVLKDIAQSVVNTTILSAWLSAILVKPSVVGTSLAYGGIVPSAAGGWVVPSFQAGGIVATVHSGEMVLPKHISDGMQNMIASGGAGGSPTINIHAVDTQTGAQFLMRNSATITQAWRSGGLSGNLSPRAISSGGRFP